MKKTAVILFVVFKNFKKTLDFELYTLQETYLNNLQNSIYKCNSSLLDTKSKIYDGTGIKYLSKLSVVF